MGFAESQATVIKTGRSIRFLQPFFSTLSFPVVLLQHLRSSRSFEISREIVFLNEVPLKPPFYRFLQPEDGWKTTFDLEIVSFSVWPSEIEISFVFCFFESTLIVRLTVLLICCWTLQVNAAVRTSAFPECESGDPDNRVWGSIKYLLPFLFISKQLFIARLIE